MTLDELKMQLSRFATTKVHKYSPRKAKGSERKWSLRSQKDRADFAKQPMKPSCKTVSDRVYTNPYKLVLGDK